MADVAYSPNYLVIPETKRRGAFYSNPLLIAAAVACAYYLGALVGYALKFPNSAPSALWPPNSILLACLLLTPTRSWAFVLLGAFPAHLFVQLQSGVPILLSLCWFSSNCFEALLGAVGIRYFARDRLPFDDLKTCTMFIAFAVFLAPFLSSFLDAAYVVLFGWKADSYWNVWRMRLRSNVTASLTLVPFIVLWITSARAWFRAASWQRYAEGFILAASLLGVSVAVFDWQVPGQGAHPALVYLPLPFLLWAAVRFGPGGATASTVSIAVISIWGAAHGRGPFIGLSPSANVETVQLFLLAISLPVLFLAATVEDARKKTQTLSESESRFRMMADTAPTLIWMADTGKLGTFFNKGWLDFTGRTLEQERGQGWSHGIHPEDLTKCMAAYAKAFDNRENCSVEYRLRRYDGEYRWVSDTGIPRFAADGTFLGYIGSAFDITERKRAEARLRAQHRVTQLLSESTTLADVAPKLLEAICESLEWKLGELWLVEPTTNTLRLFSTWYLPSVLSAEFVSLSRQFNFPPGVGLPGQVWHSRKINWIRNLSEDSNFSRGSLALKAGFRSALGFPVLAGMQTFGVMMFFSLDIREPEPELLGAIDSIAGQMVQFMERQQAEDALRKSEAKFSGILSIAADAIISVDDGHRIVLFNDCAERIFGYSKAEVLGQPLEKLLPEKSQQLQSEIIRAFDASQGEYRELLERHETLAVKKSGEEFPTEISISRLEMDGQKIFTLVLRDVTERKHAEEQLRQNEERLRLALQAGRMGVWDLDLRTRKLRWSKEHFTIMGLSTDVQPTYATWAGRVHPDDLPPAEAALKVAMAESKEYRYDYRVMLPDKQIRWVESRGTPLYDENGECVSIRGLVVDVTERKQSEEALRRALAEVQQLKRGLEADNVYLREKLSETRLHGELSGASEAIKRVTEQIRKVAATEMTVLILGETGTGKELVARAVHHNSARHARPLVKVNCSALPGDLIESELFGHERGAFTGAVARQVGRFELADGGTIFLDEIGELPLRLQAKLLRVLQEGEFERVGSGKTIKVDVRVIAATNRSLSDAVQRGRFRNDLYYRLNVYPIEMPPLRERREDIAVLGETFLHEAGRRLRKSFEPISDETIQSLGQYAWPGNVRELENVISRAAISSPGSTLQLPVGWSESPISATPANGVKKASLLPDQESSETSRTLEDTERARIIDVLYQTNWRIEGAKGAAVILGLHPNTLRSRLKKLGIAKPSKLRDVVVETTK